MSRTGSHRGEKWTGCITILVKAAVILAAVVTAAVWLS